MSNEEMYKLALFAVIRNSIIMPAGLQKGKSMKEINQMSIATMKEIIQMCDFDKLRKDYESEDLK